MDFFLIEIETKYKNTGKEKIMYRLVKAINVEDAKIKAAASVNETNFEVVEMYDLTVLPDEYNGL